MFCISAEWVKNICKLYIRSYRPLDQGDSPVKNFTDCPQWIGTFCFYSGVLDFWFISSDPTMCLNYANKLTECYFLVKDASCIIMRSVISWEYKHVSNKLAEFSFLFFKWWMGFHSFSEEPFISMFLSGKIQIFFVLYVILSPLEANMLPPPSFADQILFRRTV